MTRHVHSLILLALLLLPGCDQGPSRPHIVIVVLDTVRRDATGLPDAATPDALRSANLTPNLDALAADAVTFSRAFSAAPWTVPSHASMMTGQLPDRHFCVSLRPRLDDDLPTFAAQLRAAGYATGAFFSNPWLSDRATRVLRGFEVQRESEISGLLELKSRVGDQGGQETVDAATDWLRERAQDDSEPFLLFVNLLETHLAYDPPAAYREQHLGDLPPGDAVSIAWGMEFNAGLHRDEVGEGVDWDRVQRLYAGDVWFTDQLLGRILAQLEELGLADDTIVVVTSDHGENLGDHGLAEHQFSVHETLLAVPLVVHVPGKWRDVCDPGAPPGGRRDDPVQLTDLYATVLDAAGLDPDPEEMPPFSRSWFGYPFGAERPVFAEYGGASEGMLAMLRELNPGLDTSPLGRALGTVRVGPLRLTADDKGQVVLHNMEDDPGQQVDIAADHEEITDLLLKMLLTASLGGPEGQDPVSVDPETRRALESLGYVH